MKSLLLASIPFFIISCGSQESAETSTPNEAPIDSVNRIVAEQEEVTETDIALPDRLELESAFILDQDFGDLDKDGTDELVVVFAQDTLWDSPAPRDFVIYKQNEGQWDVWFENDNVILRADEGGVMGDPFYEGVEIKNGVIHISYNGGSSWKWGYTDKFRYQDGDFYLIGHTGSSGKPCEYWEDVDYNLSTGKCIYKFQVDVQEGCGDEYDPRQQYGEDVKEEFNHKMEELPTLANHRDYNYSFESPKGKKIYL